MGDTGFDSPPDSSGKVGDRNKSGAHSGARGDVNAILADQDDPRLAWLIDAWPTMSDDARDAVARLAGLRPDDLNDVGDLTPVLTHVEGVLP